jgi:hypothetical protein
MNLYTAFLKYFWTVKGFEREKKTHDLSNNNNNNKEIKDG